MIKPNIFHFATGELSQDASYAGVWLGASSIKMRRIKVLEVNQTL
ncbi:hypothetical protein [Virgibacillus sp. YIM 98842]|jgi:hypothetical protein|nr:hypothetical protein [Virgibacillus sp. YIM 98842]